MKYVKFEREILFGLFLFNAYCSIQKKPHFLAMNQSAA